MSDPSVDVARQQGDRYWEALLELDPVLATQIGDDRFDDRLPDPSDAGRDRERRAHRSALEDAASVDRDALPEEGRITLDVIEAIAARGLSQIEHRTDRFTAVTHLLGPAQLLAVLGTIQRADTPERVDAYARRLEAIPAYFAALGDVAEDGVAHGMTAPGLVVDRTIAQVERLLAMAPGESPGMSPVAGGPDDARRRVEATLRDTVWPAHAAYLEMLRRYRPSARDSIGLSALPGGDAIYTAEIRNWTTVPLEAEEIHRIGLEELEQIDLERGAIASRLGFADADAALAAHQASGKNSASSREDLVRLAEEQVRRGWEAAPRFFGRLPKAECEVRPVEEFREKDSPFAFYQPAPGDNSRPGIYYVNTGGAAEQPLHMLATTSYHEANPGHHFQISIEQELGDRPSIRRFGGFLVGSSFGEGWGLYCERLADEMGLYTDEYERLGMLGGQAWRAARLVVDTGIHAMGWDRERAVDLIQRAIGGPRMNAEIEVDRYIAWPGQALSYKIGQREIQRYRSEAEARAGSAFSLKAFHDRLLSLGSLPLPVLRRELATG